MKAELTQDFLETKEIKNITIIAGYSSQKENDDCINKYLESGWKLLALLPQQSEMTSGGGFTYPQLTYSLGWFKEEKAPHFAIEKENYGKNIIPDFKF